jgi:DNA-binding XRE family transcriptional regulator
MKSVKANFPATPKRSSPGIRRPLGKATLVRSLPPIPGLRDTGAPARKHAKRGSDADLLALAAALRDARAKADMTQAQLALVSGVGRDTIIALENGRASVSLGLALRAMKGLGLTLRPVAVRR